AAAQRRTTGNVERTERERRITIDTFIGIGDKYKLRRPLSERFVLSCTSKGMATDSSGTVSLCSSCWMWRRLPDNYAPQYINELVCDTSDSSCLSGE
ncbi:unnamed protein product, partial [Haemonchus placei]|uniref:CW-type domain-containing protein n=1 Tax=Haemonchus placei TaxID=6290 RepID=A0A0N4W106_HAEPC